MLSGMMFYWTFVVLVASNGSFPEAFSSLTAARKRTSGTQIAEKQGTYLSSAAVDILPLDPVPPIVALNVILRIKPEVREKFLEVIQNNQRGTLNKELEPMALEYIFGEDENEPNTFHFHEKYMGEEGIKAHQAAPHFAAWEDFAQTDPFTANPEVYKFTIYED